MVMGVLYVNYEYLCLKEVRMQIDIEIIIATLEVFSNDGSKFFHNCIGINDEDAPDIIANAENIVNGYMERTDDWEVTDVIGDLLVATKFYHLNSPQALFLLLHGYHCLALCLEPDNDYFCLSEHITAEDIQQNINNNTN